eukprot:COSAG04_NODE_773_length_10423_cov_33.575165_6_plen_30_part_00
MVPSILKLIIHPSLCLVIDVIENPEKHSR